MERFTFLIIFLFACTTSFGQVGIGTLNPDASAILDLSASDKGVLIPRTDTATVNAAVSPATGLMIYQITDNLFYFHNGVKWVALRAGEINRISDNDNDTWIDVENTIDEDTIRINVKGNEFIKLDGKSIHASAPGESLFIGLDAGKIDDGTNNRNTFLGIKAGLNNTSGDNNIFIGHKAGMSNNSLQNVMIGNNSGSLNDMGVANTFLGYNSGGNIASEGSRNTFIGSNAGQNVSGDGSNNTFLGYYVGVRSQNVHRNTCLGAESGFFNFSGSGNVFIGFKSGYNESGSDKLYIANNSTTHPLIYGEFNNNYLEVNGDINIDRGEMVFGLTRKLTLSGARNNLGNPFAEIIFNNFDNDIADVEYPGAKISSQNQSGYYTGDLRFWTTDELSVPKEKMIITHEGLIGIGTSDPTAMLHLNGGNLRVDRGSTTSGLTRIINIGGARSLSGNDYAQLRFDNYDDNSSPNDITRAMISSTNSNAEGNGDLRFHTYNGTLNEVMRIEGGGNVGIGNINPDEKLDVDGNAKFRSIGTIASANDLLVTSNGTLTTAASDKRLKENISTLENALSTLKNLRGVSFTWKDEPQLGKRHGVIAQEVQEVLPELVFQGNNGYFGVNSSQLVGLFIEAIKEQQGTIENLKVENQNQNQLIQQLLERVTNLESQTKSKSQAGQE